MAPNTFEGVWAQYLFGERFKMQTYFLSRWAGFDSGENQDQFKSLYRDTKGEKGWGGAGASLAYAFENDNEASLWYYHIDKMSDIVYAETAGHFSINEDYHIEYGLQVSTIQELDHSNVSGDVIGVMAIIDYDVFFFGLAGNYAFVSQDQSITDGFGGGPYYTSLDESTIGFVSEQSPGVDILSTRIGLGANFEAWGIKGLTCEVVHGDLKSTDTLEWFKENDIALSYEDEMALSLSAVFANFYVYESKNTLDNGHFNRFVIRADYNF